MVDLNRDPVFVNKVASILNTIERLRDDCRAIDHYLLRVMREYAQLSRGAELALSGIWVLNLRIRRMVELVEKELCEALEYAIDTAPRGRSRSVPPGI